jgi:polyphosphate kinase 2
MGRPAFPAVDSRAGRQSPGSDALGKASSSTARAGTRGGSAARAISHGLCCPEERSPIAKAKAKASSADSHERRLTAKTSASAASAGQASRGGEPTRKELTRKRFETELLKLQRELVIMQEYVRAKGLKIVVIFEGRDAAGKGGVIKRIAERTNPRICRVVALPAPTEREKTQWYFQRYVAHLPAAGEIVLFDRSWYNRAGVERVMGFCTEREYEEFMRSCPEFEHMLVRSGIQLIKYWFSVSDHEQERRFQARVHDPMRRWKLSPMDLESRARWVAYSRAKDEMFRYTDIKVAPWYVVEADDKRRARLNCIAHLLSLIDYEDLTPPPLELPPRAEDAYLRPPFEEQTFVPNVY